MAIDQAPRSSDRRSITPFCRVNLEIQGNLGFTDSELRAHRTGFRFAYQMCFLITLIGTVLRSVPILAVAATTAFFAMFPSRHPFDSVYDATLGRWLNRPKLPPRTPQGRFACSLATGWLLAVIVLFEIGMPTVATIAVSVLLISAALVGFFDICVPSMIYNLMVFRRLTPKGSDL